MSKILFIYYFSKLFKSTLQFFNANKIYLEICKEIEKTFFYLIFSCL